MDSSDSSPSKKSGRGRGRGRGSGVRGRPRGSGRGRGKRAVKLILSDDEESDKEEPFSASDKSLDTENEKSTPVKEKPASPEITTKPPEFDLEADISQLEAPTFTTLNRGPPEPMLRLDWSLPVNLIGEKVLNPMIHCCDKCLNPILIYGRLIPCKHVYCLGCGRQEESKPCPRCKERVQRVEQTGLAQLFMCTHGGSRYGHDGCRRTYLSQRDLQAHVNHRHLRLPREPQKISTVSSLRGGIDRSGPISSNNLGSSSHHTTMSVANNRSNLVSIPIQDSSPARSNYSPYVSHSPASNLVTSGGGYSAYAGQNNVGVPPHHNLQPYNQGYFNTPPSFPQPPPPPPPLPTYDNTSGYQWGGHNQSYYHR